VVRGRSVKEDFPPSTRCAASKIVNAILARKRRWSGSSFFRCKGGVPDLREKRKSRERVGKGRRRRRPRV